MDPTLSDYIFKERMDLMQRVPFSPAELEASGVWPDPRPGAPGVPILNTPVTPRENFRAFLAGKRPLWMPSFAETCMFMPALIPDNPTRGFVREDTPYTGPYGGADWLGVSWVYDPATRSSMVRPGAPKVPDITRWEHYLTFPDLDSLDWAGSAAANQSHRTDRRAVQAPVYTGLFERLVSLLDMSGALIALVDPEEQGAVHRLFDRLCVFYDDLFAHLARWYRIDYLWFHDDWGTQRAPFFSADTCREMLLPYLRRVVESAHRHGFGFEMHSCGKIEPLLPVMIEAGVDMWGGQPLNDKATLYREYGRDIKLGVDMAPLPPDAADALRRETVERFLERYPDNCYWAMDFSADRRCYPFLYEASRRLYSR